MLPWYMTVRSKNRSVLGGGALLLSSSVVLMVATKRTEKQVATEPV